MRVQINKEDNSNKPRRLFLRKIGLGSIAFGTTSTVFASEKNSSKKLKNIAKRVWDPYDYGAKGDGKALDTRPIQAAIDACHTSGGGMVYLGQGKFLSGTIYLKNNVNLQIESGCVLLGSTNLDDYPITQSNYPSYTGEFVTNKMLIYSENAQNISVTGGGLIDGNGDTWIEGPYGFPSFSVRPRIIHLRGCENVLIRDVTLNNSASWVQSYQSCSNLVIDGIKVDSRPNKDIEKDRFVDAKGRNNDGLNLTDCQVVRVSNCYINSGDDGIVLKSYSSERACQDITITNCVVSSNASGIKIGTETAGGFEDILVQNCTVFDTRCDGLSVMTVDGAFVKRVIFSNITLRNVKGAAIFIRIGERNRAYEKEAISKKGLIKDILIKDIMGTRISGYGCSITGVPGNQLENITLSNISLRYTNGMRELIRNQVPGRQLSLTERMEEIERRVPELVTNYPNGNMFGRLPAYGFFIRHIKGISLDKIQLSFDEEDIRPAIICENVVNLKLDGIYATVTDKTPEFMRLENVKDAIIRDCRAIESEAKVFLSVKGSESQKIIFYDDFFDKNASIKFEREELKRHIKTIFLQN